MFRLLSKPETSTELIVWFYAFYMYFFFASLWMFDYLDLIFDIL